MHQLRLHINLWEKQNQKHFALSHIRDIVLILQWRSSLKMDHYSSSKVVLRPRHILLLAISQDFLFWMECQWFLEEMSPSQIIVLENPVVLNQALYTCANLWDQRLENIISIFHIRMDITMLVSPIATRMLPIVLVLYSFHLRHRVTQRVQ